MKLLWPAAPQVVGVFVGGCVKRGEGSSFRAKAHAHTAKADRSYHWICVRSVKRVGEWVAGSGLPKRADGVILKPSRLLMHEYAHVLTDHGHDDTWRVVMRELHQPIEAHERRRVRRRRMT